MANGFTTNYKHHEGCNMCKDDHKHKHSTENENADIHNNNEKETTQPRTETEGKYIEVFNNTEATNTTEILVSPTESSQNVTQKENIDTASSQLYVSYSPPTYEVHENVIDVPDNRTPAGPIITNYTRTPVLNTVRPNDSTTVDTGSTVIDRVTEANIKKKDCISILHVKVETEEKHKEINKGSGIFKGIKDYFNGLHKGFLNSIHNIFHKRDGHIHRRKRAADGQHPKSENRGRQNSNNVDKTDYFVRQQHISLT